MRLRAVFAYLAFTLVLACALIAKTYPLVGQPGTHAVVRVGTGGDAFLSNDQLASISGGARNAAALLDGDLRRLIDNGLCYPTPRAATLGEHLIEPSLLGAPVYALSRNPVLAYNSALLLSFLIAGLSAFALTRYYTGSWIAAAVAGSLYSLHPVRFSDIAHLHVIGVHWLPLVLLFFERLLRAGGLLDAVALALCATLQALVGSYPMIVLGAFAAPYGALRLIQLRAELDRRKLLLLFAAVGCVACVVAAIAVTYSLSAGAWQTLEPRPPVLVRFQSLLPGGINALGIAALLLGACAGAGALWTRRSPALPLLVGSVTCILIASNGALWPGGPVLSGVYPWLVDRFWMLGAVRVPGTVRHGAILGVALMAGLGAALLLVRLRGWRLQLGRAALLLLVFGELLHPWVSARVYGREIRLEVKNRTPARPLLRAYAEFSRRGLAGPIVEIPYAVDRGLIFQMPGYLLAAAYHQMPTAACFNSYTPPSYFNIARIVSRLPEDRAVRELAAIGLRNLVIWTAPIAPVEHRIASALEARNDVELMARSMAATSLRLRPANRTHSNAAWLRLVGGSRRNHRFQGAVHRLVDLEILNEGGSTWVLPAPIRAHEAQVRWWDGDQPGPWRELRVMLPLALATGERDRVRAEIGSPPAGCKACTPELKLPELDWNIRLRE